MRTKSGLVDTKIHSKAYRTQLTGSVTVREILRTPGKANT